MWTVEVFVEGLWLVTKTLYPTERDAALAELALYGLLCGMVSTRHRQR